MSIPNTKISNIVRRVNAIYPIHAKTLHSKVLNPFDTPAITENGQEFKSLNSRVLNPFDITTENGQEF